MGLAAEPLYRPFHDLARLPAGGGFEIAIDPLTQRAHLLAPDRARALAACRGPATLEQHAARAALALDPALARAAVAELADAGLLRSVTDLSRLAAAAPAPDAPARVGLLGVATRGRSASLRIALASQLADAARHGRALRCVIAEGAVAPAARAETRALLAAIAAQHGVTIFHAGEPERAAYADALADRAGVPREVAAFALTNPEGCPIDTGAGRNAILLHAIDEPLLMIDDDTCCRVARAPAALPGLALTSAADPAESWFPPPGELPEGDPIDAPFLALHESLLGRSVTALAAAHAGALDLDHAGGRFFRRLARTGGRVLRTVTGWAGDTGTGSMGHYLLFRGPTRDRLLAGEDTYRRAFTSRIAVRAVTRASISDGASCMSLGLGLDGRALLPPFFPVQRNADGIFGIALRAVASDSFVGLLPFVIEHRPPAPRSAPFEAFFAALGRTPSDEVMALLVASSAIDLPEDPRRAHRALGAALVRAASRPLADFEEQARLLVLRARGLDLALLDESRRTHRGAPAFWARDVERAIGSIRAAVASPALAHPADLAAALGEERARSLLPRLARRYGELLERWPDLVDAARSLAAEGVHPGVRVD